MSKKSKNLLDIDFLEFVELDKNELEEDLFGFNELDINDLNVELLGNILDQLAAALAQSEMIDGRTSGFNKVTQVNTLVSNFPYTGPYTGFLVSNPLPIHTLVPYTGPYTGFLPLSRQSCVFHE